MLDSSGSVICLAGAGVVLLASVVLEADEAARLAGRRQKMLVHKSFYNSVGPYSMSSFPKNSITGKFTGTQCFWLTFF